MIILATIITIILTVADVLPVSFLYGFSTALFLGGWAVYEMDRKPKRRRTVPLHKYSTDYPGRKQ